MADLNEIAGGTVADAEKQLSSLSDQELRDLRDIEKAGKDRSTLIEAIDAELDGRGDKLTGREARMATMTSDFSE